MKKFACIICKKPLNNGIMINRKGICRTCEERMLNINSDNDIYNYMVKRIRINLVIPTLRGVDVTCQDYHL